MTDTEKLNDRIRASGLKKKHIALTLGIADATLSRKIKNYQGFTSEEIKRLCSLLNITDLEDKEAIFFAS